MSEIKDLTEKIRKFRDERDWAKFHNYKDIGISLSLEAAEVLEHFQWKTSEEIEEYVKEHKEDIGDEIADVAFYLLELCDKLELDFTEIVEKKLAKTAKKYPVEKARGSAKKYDEL
jgi:dCTP diphosphatase